MDLKVPRVRDGGYFPSLLEPRRRAERALSAVVQEAYVHGVSTRKVDDLVKALGMSGISKSRVSEVCKELDEEVERFRSRPLEGSYPYVWVDATYLKARQDGRVASTAVVIAVGVKAQTGEREVLGFDMRSPAKTALSGRLFCALWSLERTRGSEACNQRRPPGLEGRCGGCLGRCLVAKVPGAFHAQRPLVSSEDGPTDGAGDRPSAPSSPNPTHKVPASSGSGSRRASAPVFRDSRS